MAGTSFGAKVALAVTALQGRLNGEYWQSPGIANTDGLWGELFFGIVTDTNLGSANGTVDAYLAGSVDGGVTFAGGASGADAQYTDTGNVDPSLLRFLGAIPVDASEAVARTYHHHMVVHDLPENFAIILLNASGQPLGGTGNSVEYRLNKVA